MIGRGYVNAMFFLGLVSVSIPVAGAPFSVGAPGSLADGQTGVTRAVNYYPGILFPIIGGGFANSQWFNPGGTGSKTTGDQCSASNYDYSWQDTYCEKRPGQSYADPTDQCPDLAGHQGLDIRPPTCRRDFHLAVAAVAGVATVHGGTTGKYIVTITDDDGRQFSYLHMSSVQVTSGSRISKGDVLGYVSNLASTGKAATTFHLHFEMEQRISTGAYSRVAPYTTLVESLRNACAVELCNDRSQEADRRLSSCVGRCDSANDCRDNEDVLIRNRYYNASGRVVGFPIDNGGGLVVHKWYEVVLQDFSTSRTCPDSRSETYAIIANHNLGKAYVVRGGIWAAYKCLVNNAGPRLLGAPSSEELQVSLAGGGVGRRQTFEGGHIWWGPGPTCPTSEPCLHVHIPGVRPEINADCRNLAVVENSPGPDNCLDSCTPGTAECTSPMTRSFCGYGIDMAPCYTMSPDQQCVGDTLCQSGYCSSVTTDPSCTDECIDGQRRCTSNPATSQACVRPAGTGTCSSWSTVQECGEGTTCISGECTACGTPLQVCCPGSVCNRTDLYCDIRGTCELLNGTGGAAGSGGAPGWTTGGSPTMNMTGGTVAQQVSGGASQHATGGTLSIGGEPTSGGNAPVGGLLASSGNAAQTLVGGVPSAGGTLGIGGSHATGGTLSSGGVATGGDTGGGTSSCLPSSESCTNAGIDNDCDGDSLELVDGVHKGDACATGKLGRCSVGNYACDGATLGCIPNLNSATEVCGNNTDDDCDGVVDNDCDGCLGAAKLGQKVCVDPNGDMYFWTSTMGIPDGEILSGIWHAFVHFDFGAPSGFTDWAYQMNFELIESGIARVVLPSNLPNSLCPQVLGEFRHPFRVSAPHKGNGQNDPYGIWAPIGADQSDKQPGILDYLPDQTSTCPNFRSLAVYKDSAGTWRPAATLAHDDMVGNRSDCVPACSLQ